MVRCRTAANIPSGMAIVQVNKIVVPATIIVRGSLSQMTSRTGRLNSTEKLRSPRTTFEIHLRYW